MSFSEDGSSDYLSAEEPTAPGEEIATDHRTAVGNRTDRESLCFLAAVAAEAQRYDDVLEFVKKLALLGVEMSHDERNLFSHAYKTVFLQRQRSLFILELPSARKDETLASYRTQLENELIGFCVAVIESLGALLSAKCTTESKVLYFRMQGDYYRYQVPLLQGQELVRQSVVLSADVAYTTAQLLAEQLHPAHPIRLAAALNYAIFFATVYDSLQHSLALTKATVFVALANSDSISPELSEDTLLYLELLYANIAAWEAQLMYEPLPCG